MCSPDRVRSLPTVKQLSNSKNFSLWSEAHLRMIAESFADALLLDSGLCYDVGYQRNCDGVSAHAPVQGFFAILDTSAVAVALCIGPG